MDHVTMAQIEIFNFYEIPHYEMSELRFDGKVVLITGAGGGK